MYQTLQCVGTIWHLNLIQSNGKHIRLMTGSITDCLDSLLDMPVRLLQDAILQRYAAQWRELTARRNVNTVNNSR